jgi:hypothetical protein
MYYNTTGTRNIASGYQSMYSNTTGADNTAVGEQALYSTTATSNNTAVGRKALWTSTGSSNTAVGETAAYSLSTGSNNTVIGREAGGITTGSSNIIIGKGVDAPSATASSQLNIGNWIIGKDNGKVIGYGKGSNTLAYRYTTMSGQTDCADNVWTTVAYVGHTHSADIHLLVYDGERGTTSGCTNTSYGSTYTDITRQSLNGLSGLDFRYNNSGYVLQVRANSVDGTSKEVNWTWSGLSSATPYLTS